MGMFAVKNDLGEWLGWEVYQDDPEFICGGGSVWTDLDKAKFYAKANGGHVVELTEKPEPVVVSEDEAEILEQAKQWNVKVAHTKNVWYYKSNAGDLLTICPADKELRGKFTESEIEHYGLRDCERIEVKDND